MKKQKGITLVALVISIIILLILAGISIQAITNTGIFTQANNAKRESEIAKIKEQIALDIYEKQLVPPLGSITDEQLETILEKYGTVNKEDGTIVGITTEKGYEILLKDIYGGETVAESVPESVPEGATVTPVNDITTWLKTAEISKQYSYTTIEQVIADGTCTKSLMNNENAMKYLARSTEFANAICASETTMTALGKSAYVDDTVLNSEIWVEKLYKSPYWEQVFEEEYYNYKMLGTFTESQWIDFVNNGYIQKVIDKSDTQAFLLKNVTISNSESPSYSTFQIADFNHDGTENTVDLILANNFVKSGLTINTAFWGVGNNIRDYLNSTYLNSFSDTIKSLLVEMKVSSSQMDYVKLLSRSELGVTDLTDDVSYKGIKYPIFTSGGYGTITPDRVRTGDSFSYMLRTPYGIVYGENGYADGSFQVGNSDRGLVPIIRFTKQ